MIGILNCSMLKSKESGPAYAVYGTSPIFTANYWHIRPKVEKLFIPSAKYIVVEDSQEIEPYDKTLNAMDKHEYAIWVGKARRRLARRVRGKCIGAVSAIYRPACDWLNITYLATNQRNKITTNELDPRGYELCALIRWMSQEGWGRGEIKQTLTSLGISANKSTIGRQYVEGRNSSKVELLAIVKERVISLRPKQRNLFA